MSLGKLRITLFEMGFSSHLVWLAKSASFVTLGISSPFIGQLSEWFEVSQSVR